MDSIKYMKQLFRRWKVTQCSSVIPEKRGTHMMSPMLIRLGRKR